MNSKDEIIGKRTVIASPVPDFPSPDPSVIVAVLGHQHAAQPTHAETFAPGVNEHEPLAGGSVMNQRLRGIAQDLVLDPQMLNLTAATTKLAAQPRDLVHKL